jgi:hypothetical protein
MEMVGYGLVSIRGVLLSLIFGVTISGGAAAQDESQELAKQLSNPVASLISVPFQFNYDEGFGPNDGERVTLNIQPVIPISLNDDWTLISRTILPVIWQNDIARDSGEQSGLGDITQSLFFSPKNPGPSGIIWGVGPAFLVPTGTDDLLGTGKWGAGPTAVVLKQIDGWTVGALANHIWSFAGDGDRRGEAGQVRQAAGQLHRWRPLLGRRPGQRPRRAGLPRRSDIPVSEIVSIEQCPARRCRNEN